MYIKMLNLRPDLWLIMYTYSYQCYLCPHSCWGIHPLPVWLPLQRLFYQIELVERADSKFDSLRQSIQLYSRSLYSLQLYVGKRRSHNGEVHQSLLQEFYETNMENEWIFCYFYLTVLSIICNNVIIKSSYVLLPERFFYDSSLPNGRK